ncbi:MULTISPECIES: Ger(x)C family spore germination protein [Sediminibacillus]|uniref:Ger(x)C family spore germination protein n=1 Tax=Sediminibacillus TaxID=482460 RepID=UPI0012970E2A|nr:Ger(x)C family spore germination protein [Sediminibacillus terrae]
MRPVFFFLAVGLLFLLSGCYDRIELEEQSYVIGIGIDKADNDEKGLFKITFQIANPEVGSSISSGGSDEDPQQTITVEGSDFITATNTANSIVTKEIVLDHTKVLVISEELARSGDFLRVVQSASRTTQLRRGVQIVVSREDASDFLNNNKPTLETRPHKYYQFMLNRATETGIIPDADVHRFFQITEGDADLFLAIYATTEKIEEKSQGYEDQYIAGQIPQIGSNATQFMGSAVFKEGKMIDVLTGQETRLCLIFDNTIDMDDLLATYPDPIKKGYRIAASFIKKEKTKVDIDYKKNQPSKITVTVPFSLEILAIPSLVDYAENSENQKILRKTITDDINKRAEQLVKKAQQEYRSDPFYWSIYVRKYFRTIKEYEKADWNHDIFPNADVKLDFQLTQIEFGKMLNDSDLDAVRD